MGISRGQCSSAFIRIERKRLLAQSMLAGAQHALQKLAMGCMRRRDIDRVNVGIGEQLVERIVHASDTVLLGKCNRFVMCPIPDACQCAACI